MGQIIPFFDELNLETAGLIFSSYWSGCIAPIAEAINLPQSPATVLMPAQDLAMTLAEVRGIRADFEEYRARAAEIAGE
jgi:hypothetical protein